MTTADEIMAEALGRADIGYSPTRIRAQLREDASISPNARAAKAPQPAGIRLTPEQLRTRRPRSIALALGAFVLVVFAVAIVRVGSGALTGPDYMRPVETTK
jgi:hypothetical protein